MRMRTWWWVGALVALGGAGCDRSGGSVEAEERHLKGTGTMGSSSGGSESSSTIGGPGTGSQNSGGDMNAPSGMGTGGSGVGGDDLNQRVLKEPASDDQSGMAQ